MKQRGKSVGARLGASILTCLVALLLQGVLWLTLSEIGPTSRVGPYLDGFDLVRRAQAASMHTDRHKDNDDEYILHYGIVITRPEGSIGIWVISDTVHSVLGVYTATESTNVDSEVVVSSCVEVKVAESTPTIAVKIVKKGASDCSGGDDENNDEYVVRYGVVVSRPLGSTGTWVISETAYSVIESTVVEGDLAVGDCVLVKVRQSQPTVAVKLIKQEGSKCGSGDGDEHDEFILRYGTVVSRPEGKVGTWVIADIAYTVTESTVVDDSVNVGECVQVKVAEGAPTVAIVIHEKNAFRCIDEDDDFRREWEGTIVTVPLELIGEWTISIGASKKLTFTANEDTRFVPNSPAAFSIGRWVEVKVSRRLDGTLVAERVRVDEHELGEIVVRLENAAISETLANKYSLVLTSTLLSQANIYLFTTTDEDEPRLAAQIAKEDGVVWAEVNYVNSVPEEDGYKTWGWGGATEPDAYLSQSAYQQIRLGYASRAYQGEGVVVAVLDTGLYTPHEQFAGKLHLPSLDVIEDDNDPSEDGPGLAWGHGTHVAGVIAAMAPGATILPVRVLDENGRGNTFLLAYAIEWAMQQPDVKVINLSLGTEFDSKILREVVKKATEQGIIVVAAAGNNGMDTQQYPAAYPDVVAVTAVDSNSLKASFANYGKDWVDISAPGVGIMSTMIGEDGPGYATWSGTSMATAFVSGAAALVVGKWEIEAAHGDSMLSQLLNTGLVVDAMNPQYTGAIGRLLDVSAALGVDAALIYMPKSQK